MNIVHVCVALLFLYNDLAQNKVSDLPYTPRILQKLHENKPIYKKNKLKWKALKCKPSANCGCVVPLIDGLGFIPLVARGESILSYIEVI